MIPSRSRSDLAAAKDKREPLAVTSLVKNYEGEDDLLGEGYLTKIGQRWKSHKRRWFVITFTDIRYYESRVRNEQARRKNSRRDFHEQFEAHFPWVFQHV